MQQYEWLKELYPPLFEKIKEIEKTGQWEIIGGVSFAFFSVYNSTLLTNMLCFRAGLNMVSENESRF